MNDDFQNTFRSVSTNSLTGPKTGDAGSAFTRHSISVDWKFYESYLQESGWSDDQKREFIDTIWQIVLMFVDLGFGVESGQLARREALESTWSAADEPKGRSQSPPVPTAARKGARK